MTTSALPLRIFALLAANLSRSEAAFSLRQLFCDIPIHDPSSYDSERKCMSHWPAARTRPRDIQGLNIIILNKLHDLIRGLDRIRHLRGIDQNIRPLQQRAQIARQSCPALQRLIIKNGGSVAV